jgi:DNA repair protein RadA/Sms
MAKAKTVYVCQECGVKSPKWVGKCQSCNTWNSYQEEIEEKRSASTTAYQRITAFSGDVNNHPKKFQKLIQNNTSE